MKFLSAPKFHTQAGRSDWRTVGDPPTSPDCTSASSTKRCTECDSKNPVGPPWYQTISGLPPVLPQAHDLLARVDEPVSHAGVDEAAGHGHAGMQRKRRYHPPDRIGRVTVYRRGS